MIASPFPPGRRSDSGSILFRTTGGSNSWKSQQRHHPILNPTISAEHQPTMRTELLTLAYMASVSSAARFILHVPTTNLVNPSSLTSSTHATLQSAGAPIDAYLTRSNSFNFNNVSAGSYLATVHSKDFAFEPLRIDVSVEEAVEGSGEKKEVIRAWQTFIGNEWDNKGESRAEGSNGLVIPVKPIGQKYFYQERAGCTLQANDPDESTNANSCSFSAFVPEEPHDSHGPLLYGLDLRNAKAHGEQYVTWPFAGESG